MSKQQRLWQKVFDREFERLINGGATDAEMAELAADNDGETSLPDNLTEREVRWIAKETADRVVDGAAESAYQSYRDRDI